ncbi:hypothetical protein Tco_0476418 [Tanacetum coccineum]
MSGRYLLSATSALLSNQSCHRWQLLKIFAGVGRQSIDVSSDVKVFMCRGGRLPGRWAIHKKPRVCWCQWESKVQYDTTTYMSAHYSKTTFASSEQVEVLGNDTRYTIQSVQHQPGPDNPSTFHYSYSNESNEVEPLEVLNVQKSIHPLSGSPTLSSNSIIESLSPSLTPIRNSNFLLEKTDAFLSLDSIPLGIDNETFDADRDILLLEKLLNIDSIRDLPPQELNNDSEGDILFFEKLLEDELSEAKKS